MKKKNLVPVTALCVAGILALGGCVQQEAESQEGDQVVLITLKEGAGLTATAQDIEENPLKLQLVELEAAILPRSLADLDIGVINGNYALEGDVVDQLLVSESSSSQAVQAFSNIVAIREGDGNPALEKLLQVLQGEEIRTYIEETYETVFPSAA